jgi:serine/threonine protein kinase
MSAFESTKEYELGKVLSHETHSHTYEATVKGGGVGTAAGGAGSGAGAGSGSGKSFRVRRIFGAAADRMKVDRAAAVVEQLAALTHPGLLPVIESYVLSNEDSGGRDLCVVYENLTGSSLAHKLGENSFKKDVTAGMPALELADVTELFFNIVEALKYLHSNNVAHMDIRPESVIYRGSTGSTVLMNYGMIDIVAVNAMEFIAPEIHKRESLLPEALLKADIWAVRLM